MQQAFHDPFLSVPSTVSKCCDSPFTQHVPFRGNPFKGSYESSFDSSFFCLLTFKSLLISPPSYPFPIFTRQGSIPSISMAKSFTLRCSLSQGSVLSFAIVSLAPFSPPPQVLSPIQGHTYALLVFILNYKIILPALLDKVYCLSREPLVKHLVTVLMEKNRKKYKLAWVCKSRLQSFSC